jgi:hypothetical protein
MWPDFLRGIAPVNSELFSSQWIVVGSIGFVFFLVQLVLSLSFCARMRRQERIIRRLCRDREKGGSGRGDRRDVPRSFAWLQWVNSNFPVSGAPPSNNFTREDVLSELDTRIASNGGYLLLQRMGVMAPLLGVVLTVVGFYWLKVGDGDESLQSIMSAVAPLVSGVGTGAVLALINQGLLHMAGRRVESLRMTARTWFDTVIWSRANFDTQGSAGKAVQAMERLMRSTLADIDRLSDTLARTAEISVAISALPDHIRNILDRKIHVDKADGSPTPATTNSRPVARVGARPR